MFDIRKYVLERKCLRPKEFIKDLKKSDLGAYPGKNTRFAHFQQRI